MTAPLTLTAQQVEFLRACAANPQSPFDAGSTTVNRLRTLGLITDDSADGYASVIATDAGRAWLAARGGNNGRE